MIKSLEEIKAFAPKNNIYIYGAGLLGKKLYAELRAMGITVKGFFVNSMSGNPEWIDDVFVQTIDNFDFCENYRMIVGIGRKNRKDVVEELLNRGVYALIIMDDSLTAEITRRATVERDNDRLVGTDYSLSLPEGIERGTAYITNKEDRNAGTWRIGIDNWFRNSDSFDVDFWLKNNEILKKFEEKWGKYRTVYDLGKEIDKNLERALTSLVDIYSVKCHLDSSIIDYENPTYVHEIQAGAACTEKRIADYQDNMGENISDRNRDFSECSAIYWVWKNAVKKDYVGMCHYRRRLEMSDEMLSQCISHDADVITTIPNMVFPDVHTFFTYYFIYEHDWQLMMKAIRELFPEYYSEAVAFSQGSYYLANNIFIMKQEWFDKMCQFVFAILLYIDNFYKNENFSRNDRYAGYIFEVLFGMFVMIKSKDLNIYYADMEVLSKELARGRL